MSTPLQRLRIELGMNQRELATAVGIDPGQYSRIENNKEPMTAKKAAEVSAWFKTEKGVEISELELLYPSRYPAPVVDTRTEAQAS